MRRSIVRAVRWVLLETITRNLLLLGFTIALARLLTPADFGLIAMLSLFVGVAAALAEAGLGAALIQAREPSQADISTLFWTQLAVAAILGVSLGAAGHVLARWFEQPALESLSIAYGANVLISGAGSMHLSLFTKSLRFKTTAIVALIAQVIGGSAGIVAAILDAGPWAIVAQTITQSLVTTTVLWCASDWRPSFVFSFGSLRKYSSFGLYVIGAGILGEIEQRVSSLVLGRTAGPVDTGLFQRAASLQVLLSRILSGVVTKVAFPAFSALQQDSRRLANGIREATFVNFAATAMVMWIVAVLAEPLVRFMFGSRWSPSAPVLQALCVAGGFYPIFAVYSKALRALGKARAVFMQHVARAGGMTLVAIAFGDAGLPQLAWAQAAFLILTLPMGSVGVARSTGYRVRMQLADLLPVAIAGMLMAASSLTADRLLTVADTADPIRILVVGGIAAPVFLGSLGALMCVLPMPAARMAATTIQSFVKRGDPRGEV